jgi:hypothetical protein
VLSETALCLPDIATWRLFAEQQRKRAEDTLSCSELLINSLHDAR